MDNPKKISLQNFRTLSQLRKLLYGILFFTFGFVISYAPFPLSVHPTGLSLMVFAPKKCPNFPVYSSFSFYSLCAGCLSATLAYKQDGIIYFTMYCAVFLIRLALTGGKFNESVVIKVSLSLICALCIGLVGASLSGFNIWKIFGILTLSLCTPAFTYFFEGISDRSASGILFDTACYAFVFSFLYGIRSVKFFSFSLPIIICGILTLYTAKKKGAMHGALMGLACGLAQDNFFLPPVISIMGFVGGLFFRHSDTVSILTSYVASICYGIYCAGFDAVGIMAPELLASCAAFFGIKNFITPDPYVSGKSDDTTRDSEETTEKLTKISDAFSALSEISMQSEKSDVPDRSECDYFVKRAFEQTCSECVMKHVCEVSGERNSRSLRRKISNALYDRRLASGEYRDIESGKCCHSDKIISSAMEKYNSALSTHTKNSKGQLISGEYNTVAKLLKITANTPTEKTSPPLPEAFRIKRALENMNISYRRLEVRGNRNVIIRVCGISAAEIHMSSQRIKGEIEKECGFSVELPEFFTENAEEIMQITRCGMFSPEYSRCTLPKQGEQINGDYLTVFENEDNKFYSLICDGMGSGREAANASKTAAGFIEKLLFSGSPEDITIEMLNNYLISKENECFSTIDLLEIDKLDGTASFVKAGAAPSFIVRGSKLHKISSYTPPAGILHCMNAEKTTMKLQKNDIIVMLSDGILENGDIGTWLMEFLTYKLEGTSSEMAEKIVSSACEAKGRSDDMSVAVIKIS
ncbi:MAG: SpoIIE family protein phosphatase [Clostridia bacterium]|nr:SpoIIE family protein phosphatase [Clostridia bacterium]